MNWISCKDQKPKIDQVVLIYLGGNSYFVAEYYAPSNYFRASVRKEIRDFDANDNVYWAELMPPDRS